MKFIKKDTNKLEITLLVILILLFFGIGFSRVASTIPSLLLIFFSFIYIYKSKVVAYNTFIKITGLYFLICLLSIFQESNYLEFIDKIKLKVFFIIIPVLLFSLKDLIIKHKEILTKTILAGAFFSVVFYLIVATLNFGEIGATAFTYIELFSISHINPIIYSLYINIVIIILYFQFPQLNKIIKHVLILFFGGFLLLSLSKFGIFIFVLIYCTILLLELKNNYKTGLKIIFFALLFFTLSIQIFSNNKIIAKRYKQFRGQIVHLENKNYKRSFPRLVILKSSITIAKENFLLGIGISNVKEKLQEEFVKEKYKKGLAYQLDAHNQFMQTQLGSGILGFLILLSLFLYLFYYSFKLKSILLFYTTTTIFLYSLIESIFESQMSVFIFLLFISFIIIIEENEKNKLKLQ